MPHDEAYRFTPDTPADDVALAVAADFDPALDAAALRARLDALAAPLAARVAATDAPIARVRALCDRAYGELGFRGADAYDDPGCELLPPVLERRVGSPVALAVVLCALGRRAGLRVEPVAFPGHFLVRAEGLYVDPHSGGFPIDRDGLVVLAHDALVDPSEAALALEPASPRALGVRLLLNLQNIFRARGDHARSLLVCDRLFALTDAPLHRADRGIHALALGAARSAVEDFEAYLRAHPAARDADRVRQLLARARAALARPAN